jgi:predicted dehydrogenase
VSEKEYGALMLFREAFRIADVRGPADLVESLFLRAWLQLPDALLHPGKVIRFRRERICDYQQSANYADNSSNHPSFRRVRPWVKFNPMKIAVLLCLTLTVGRMCGNAAVLRAGMIGLDTSHVPAFTKIFNDPKATGDVAGIRVAVGYPGGTDIPMSRDRVQKFTEQLREMGVEIVDSIPKLLEKVDVVLLESVDGRIHLQEAIPVIKARKPLFIDKPVAGSLADAIAIYDLAAEYKVPCFSSSSLRFIPGIQKVLQDEKLGGIVGASTWGPCSYQEGTPDLFFYGIHGIDPLFALMGVGCETVARAKTKDTDLVTGVWKDGRIGTYRGIRGNKAEFGATVYGSKAIVDAESGGGYLELCREVGRFFKTGKAPVRAEETIEIFAFMEAAEQSAERGGAPVTIESVLGKAKAEATKKLAALR